MRRPGFRAPRASARSIFTSATARSTALRDCGSGRSESVRAIFGADRVSGGTVQMNGKTVKITSPLGAMKNGISYLPEDRKRDGIIGDLSVRDNIILARQVLDGFFHPISKAKAEKYAQEYIKLLNIKTASTETPIKALSGGNQQKVILARWLLANPVYMILDEPTRGLNADDEVTVFAALAKLAHTGDPKHCVIVLTASREIAEAADTLFEI